MHLAAASMGLATQWVTIHVEEGFKKVLGVPDVMSLYLIIPVGYPDVPPKEGVRRPLSEIVHRDKYDMSKHMTNRQIVDYIYFMSEGVVIASGTPDDIRASGETFVHQFVYGEMDGPVAFHYPASDLREDIFAQAAA
jgi:hypothetical protein